MTGWYPIYIYCDSVNSLRSIGLQPYHASDGAIVSVVRKLAYLFLIKSFSFSHVGLPTCYAREASLVYC